jgi:hypothetical protein
MKRVHHPYYVWEDVRAGMYAPMRGGDEIDRARELLGNADGLLDAMNDAVDAWPRAAEHFLTDLASNRRAWLGWAACCNHAGCTAQATRAAWWQLTEDQQDEANAAADVAIKRWEDSRGGAQTLFG